MGLLVAGLFQLGGLSPILAGSNRTTPRRGGPDGFPHPRADGRRRLPPAHPPLAAPRRPGLPPLPGGRPHGRPPPLPRPGPGPPLRPLRVRLQRLHRHLPEGQQAADGPARPDPSRLRPGGLHGPLGPRAELRPLGAAGLRHRLQGHASANLPARPLADAVVEADEAYQDAGEKRAGARRARRPAAAAGQQAAGPRHLGDNDRPPVCGVVGRETGRLRPAVADHADEETL